MHVGLNLLYLVPGATGGTETYARELIPELVSAAPDVRFTAFINLEAEAHAGAAPWRDLIPAITVPVHSTRRTAWAGAEQSLLPRIAAATGVDVLHSLANTGPTWGRFKRIVTIHDLLHRLVPAAHAGLLGAGMRVLVTAAARRSDRVIVDAASTVADLRRLLGVDASRIDTVALGYGTVGRAAPMDPAGVRREVGSHERQIVLCPAAKRPHKNLERLLEATSLIPADRRPLVVIPGYPTPYEQILRKRAAELGVTGDVRLLGWIGGDLLEGLYATARCLVFPSLYEGFGLPVLEAMGRGLPVICSDRGALAEVAGGAAVLVDPLSPSQIAAAMERLLTDDREVELLRTAGLLRAETFTWAATAAGTLASYRRALSVRSAQVS
jgi:glycosyltransferase involved in cell wall biosynthesis